MASVTKPHTFVQGAPANASEVNADFDTLYNHVNTEVVHKDGSVPMTGPLTLPGPPTAGNHAATKAYADGLASSGAPAGVVWMYGGSAAPSGWLLCDGTAVSRTTYSALFAVIGTAFGAGDGSTTFNLPDLKGRVPLGAGAGAGLTSRTLGAKTGGEVTGGPSTVSGVNTGSGNVVAGYSHTHSNIQPSTVVNFIIKT